jgi:ABC-type branched-subunit amino acid transport system substrate-binding protein
MGWQPTYQAEGKIYAQHLMETKPNGKVGILFQNDDYGKDYLKGFIDGLGEKSKTMIIKQLSYEVTDPTIDSQMVELKASGADVFYNVTTPKFAAQAIKKAAEIGWKPLHYLNSVSNSPAAVMNNAGSEASLGILTVYYLKDPTDSQWFNTPEYKDWLAFMQKYYPGGDIKDNFNVFGYTMAQGIVQVLKQCGDNLTRENIMKQAANLDMTLPMLLPGVNVKTSADDFYPIEREQVATWDGKTWALSGKTLGR